MRNFLHYLIGFIVMYLIAYFCKFHTYLPQAKYIGVTILSIFNGLIIGVGWELYQLKRGDTLQIGWDDVIRTTVGTLIGGIVGTFLIY